MSAARSGVARKESPCGMGAARVNSGRWWKCTCELNFPLNTRRAIEKSRNLEFDKTFENNLITYYSLVTSNEYMQKNFIFDPLPNEKLYSHMHEIWEQFPRVERQTKKWHLWIYFVFIYFHDLIKSLSKWFTFNVHKVELKWRCDIDSKNFIFI